MCAQTAFGRITDASALDVIAALFAGCRQNQRAEAQQFLRDRYFCGNFSRHSIFCPVRSYLFVQASHAATTHLVFSKLGVFVYMYDRFDPQVVGCPINVMHDSRGYYKDVITPFEALLALEPYSLLSPFPAAFLCSFALPSPPPHPSLLLNCSILSVHRS